MPSDGELLPAGVSPPIGAIPQAPRFQAAEWLAMGGVSDGRLRGNLYPRPPDTPVGRNRWQRRHEAPPAGAILGAVPATPPGRAGDDYGLLHGGQHAVEAAAAGPHSPGGDVCIRGGQAMAARG